MRNHEPRVTDAPRVTLLAADPAPLRSELLAPLQARSRNHNICRPARHPAALRAVLAWFRHESRCSNNLPAQVREIAALPSGGCCWAADTLSHVLIGESAGLSDTKIAAIETSASVPWRSPAGRDAPHPDQFISNSGWQMLCVHLTEQQRIVLMVTIGQSRQISMLLNSAGVAHDHGLTLDPAPAGRP